MKKLIMDGPRVSKIIDVDIPKIDDNNLLVKVKYTGMCHSEWYPWTVAKKGDIFGHETCGIIAEVGKNVKGFKVGDRVTGLGGGGYCEYIVMNPQKTMHIPENLSFEDAIVEPLGCIMSGGSRMMPKIFGDDVAVVGAGYMGLGIISLFRAVGYNNIIAIDKRDEALENAIKYGATRAIHPEELSKSEYLNFSNWTSPDLRRDGHRVDIFSMGFDNVMEFTGTPDGLKLATDLVCAHGRLGIGGYHNDGERTMDFKLINMKAMEMINCHERRIEFETGLCRRALDLISKDIWKFRGGVNKFYTLEEFDEANYDMETHKDGFIKAAVTCD